MSLFGVLALFNKRFRGSQIAWLLLAMGAIVHMVQRCDWASDSDDEESERSTMYTKNGQLRDPPCYLLELITR
eukprot:COSAG06_NODE_238_length_19422_cov_16.417741_22_plen_73_part_00